MNVGKTNIFLHSKQKGFTIVELLIVIVVIAILAAITIIAFNGIQNRSRQSAAQSTASQAAKKLSTIATQNANIYPSNEANFLTETGLTESGGTTFQYTPGAGFTSYCLTTIIAGNAYYTTSASPTPAAGLCPGHTLAGNPEIVNLVVNPALETDGNGWTGSSSSLNPVRVQVSGNWVYRGVRTDTVAAAIRAAYSLPSTLTIGTTYTASMEVYSSVATTIAVAIRQAGTTNAFTSTDHTFSAGETKRISTTGVATVNSAYVAMYSGVSPVGSTFYVDKVMLTEGSTVYSYADGDSPGWAWDGTPGNSTSRGPAP